MIANCQLHRKDIGSSIRLVASETGIRVYVVAFISPPLLRRKKRAQKEMQNNKNSLFAKSASGHSYWKALLNEVMACLQDVHSTAPAFTTPGTNLCRGAWRITLFREGL